jgi:ankyrin repeat protein
MQNQIVKLFFDMNFEQLHNYKNFDFSILMKNNVINNLLEFGSKSSIIHVFKNIINIDATNDYGQNALHLTCIRGCYMYSKYLIDRGIEINAKDIYGNTPLHYASRNCKPIIVSLLLKNGGNINSIGYMNYLPIHIACIHDNRPIVEILIDNNSPLEIPDIYGNTPLHYACVNNNFSLVKILIQGNCNNYSFDVPRINLNPINCNNLCPIDITTCTEIKAFIINKSKMIENFLTISNEYNLYSRIHLAAKMIKPTVTMNEVIFKLRNMHDLIKVFNQIGNFDDEIVQVMTKRVIDN